MRLNSRTAPLVVAILAVVVLSACGGKADNSGSLRLAAGSNAAVPTAAPDCPDGFVVRLDANEHNRVMSGGVKAVESEDFRKEILDFNRHDPRGLYLYHNASPLGEASPVGSVEELVDGGKVQDGVCYSERGRKAFEEWSILWKTARIKAVDRMPAGWGNTGVANGAPTSGPSPTGKTGGWMVVFVGADGNPVLEHGVMKRCGNPVSKKPPAPPGPTDEPAPKPTPTTQPPGTTPTTARPVCPYNPALPPDHPQCLKPKDPTQDVLVNPDVPAQVRGPGCQYQVSPGSPCLPNPGPATPVCDSPNGYCPGSDPNTTTTTTSRPSGSGSTTTSTVPSCGQAGQPSCDNTGVSPPTTVAPPPAPPVTSSPSSTVPSP